MKMGMGMELKNFDKFVPATSASFNSNGAFSDTEVFGKNFDQRSVGFAIDRFLAQIDDKSITLLHNERTFLRIGLNRDGIDHIYYYTA